MLLKIIIPSKYLRNLLSCVTADRWRVDADLQNVCKFMQHSPVPKP